MKSYTIATEKTLYDIDFDNELTEINELAALTKEQNSLIDLYTSKNCVVCITNWNDKKSYYTFTRTSKEELLQYLAIKDGIDVIRFEDGKIGIVAYYNGKEEYLQTIEVENIEKYENLTYDQLAQLF